MVAIDRRGKNGALASRLPVHLDRLDPVFYTQAEMERCRVLAHQSVARYHATDVCSAFGLHDDRCADRAHTAALLSQLDPDPVVRCLELISVDMELLTFVPEILDDDEIHDTSCPQNKPK